MRTIRPLAGDHLGLAGGCHGDRTAELHSRDLERKGKQWTFTRPLIEAHQKWQKGSGNVSWVRASHRVWHFQLDWGSAGRSAVLFSSLGKFLMDASRLWIGQRLWCQPMGMKSERWRHHVAFFPRIWCWMGSVNRSTLLDWFSLTLIFFGVFLLLWKAGDIFSMKRQAES
jgi:hypothetical protein